ncbi:EamA family transporter [Nocardioides sp. TF02-7]|uniref:EamA family transporter n=1 Tax=Nocardioides sp. TF02-7 TaxID=2917724 RepID=UPI001F052C74|nr:EamA family transporter [Nocardioides sp. TF02-7]UMG92793.1 EamA family transporter [Nocardioides sp. TF02-7]
MGVVLALLAALAYGVCDFIGGVASRRTTPWPVAFLAGVGGTVGAVALAVAASGSPSAVDLAWGGLAGLGTGAGSAFLYRGFSVGRIGVVAPVSAVGAALLPLVVGVGLGDRPGALAWLGIALALPGIWLVARIPEAPGAGSRRSGLADGVLAGAGFGLLFAAMGQVREDAGSWPLVACQGAGAVTIAVLAVLLGGSVRVTARTEWWGFVSGLLAAAAVLAFQLATQVGTLTVAAVLTSLYPAVTVLLAALALRERVFGAQTAGLLLSGAAVALIAAG